MKIRTLILTLFFLPSIAWADDVTVNSVTDFGTLQTHTNNYHYILSDGKTYILDTDITTAGYLYIQSGSTVVIDLNGHTINRNLNSPVYNGHVIKNEGTLTIKNTGNGENGKITGGFNNGSGGGIYNKGALTIEGGTITNNKARFYQNDDDKKAHGGGIMVKSGQLILKGGIITNNKANESNDVNGGYGGGVYIASDGSLKIEGNPQITDNVRYTSADNLYLPSGKIITIVDGNLTGSNETIGISMQTFGTFTSGLSSETKFAIFKSDNNHYETDVADGNEAQLQTCWMGLVKKFNLGGDIELNSAKVYEASSTDPCLTVPSGKSITLDLKGQTLDRKLTNAIEDGCVIKNNGTLSITNSTGTGYIKGGRNSTGGGGIHNLGTLTITGGNIQGNISTNQGGGILNTNSLTISGGTIESNTASNTNGGGIYNTNTGTLIISGGSIKNNSATEASRNGGGIYNAGSLTISGGEIKSNSAPGFGAGIYHDGTAFNLEGEPNISSNADKNVYLTAAHHIINITGSLTYSDQNAISLNMETFSIFTYGLNTHGSISKFSSEAGNSVVLVNNAGEAELITRWNYLNRQLSDADISTIDLETGTYQAGSSDSFLHVPSGRTVTINLNGRNLNRNLSSATDNGCVIFNEGNLTIQNTSDNCSITGGFNSDETTIKGGGICNAGTLIIESGTISGNKTALLGGGIYNGGTLTVKGGTNNNNTSSGDAAANGIYHCGTQLNIEGAPNINIYLATGKTLIISNPLTNSSQYPIKIASAEEHLVFTPSVNTVVYKEKFASNQTGKGIGFNSGGEAMIGTSYTLTRSNVTAPATAIKDELVTVTVSASNGYIPISLNYTDENQSTTSLSDYPDNGSSYNFVMPAKNLSVTATCFQGGYCGAGENLKKMKYYLQEGTLKFITDGDNCAMENYNLTDNLVPWRGLTYSAIDISSHVTTISDYAFTKIDNGKNFVANTNLTSASIPTNITTIGEKAFFYCTALTGITVDPGNTNYKSTDGVLFNKAGTELICYPAGKQETEENNYTYTISNTVQTITNGAFAFNTSLRNIAVEPGGIPSLKGVDGVLYNALGTILICYPAGKTDENYTIAENVTEIKPYAFQSAVVLQYVYLLPTDVPSGGTHMFDGTTCKIMVLANLVNTYKGTDYWKDYQSRIYEIDMTSVVITLTSDADAYDFTGSAVMPAVTQIKRTFDNYILQSGIDYSSITESSYTNNTALGTGTVTINGLGNYAGLTATKDFDITKRVVISGATGPYSTYYHTEGVTLSEPSGLQAYTISSINWETGATELSARIGCIPTATPVLLWKNSNCNGTYHLKVVVETASASPAADFKGVIAETAYNTLMDGNKAIYILKGGQFYRATSGSLSANRCYLAMPNSSSYPALSRVMFGDGEDGATGIDSPAVVPEDQNDWYSLDGRKLLGRPTQKGVYISNGKKVVIH